MGDSGRSRRMSDAWNVLRGKSAAIPGSAARSQRPGDKTERMVKLLWFSVIVGILAVSALVANSEVFSPDPTA